MTHHGVDGALTKLCPKSSSGVQWVVRGTGMSAKVFPSESLALWSQWRRCCGRRNHVGSFVAGTFTLFGLQVKLLTIAHRSWQQRRTVSVPPWRLHGGGLASTRLILVFSVESLGYPCAFICFTFIWFFRGNSHQFVSVRTFDFIDKAGWKHVSTNIFTKTVKKPE
jgi:hypothetical protein